MLSPLSLAAGALPVGTAEHYAEDNVIDFTSDVMAERATCVLLAWLRGRYLPVTVWRKMSVGAKGQEYLPDGGAPQRQDIRE